MMTEKAYHEAGHAVACRFAAVTASEVLSRIWESI